MFSKMVEISYLSSNKYGINDMYVDLQVDEGDEKMTRQTITPLESATHHKFLPSKKLVKRIWKKLGINSDTFQNWDDEIF